MLRTFRAEKMLKRVKAEGKEHLLDEETVALIKSLDGKQGSDYNWESFVNGQELVWIEPGALGGDFKGAYVALCDCD